jgi:hypothetical protein
MKNMRNCPFCKAEVEAENSIYGVHYNRLCGKWLFSHQCKTTSGLPVELDITVYGMTEQEVIDRWNNRHEDEESEGV